MAATIDFGIDLGTTNSSVGLCRQGEVRIFQTADLMNVTPSVVYVSKTGRMLVGKKAYDTWVADPQNTQAEFKRWMGYSDRLSFPASGKSLSAEELSAEVLKSLRRDAENETHETIDAAVITVPAAFGSLQCDATAKAARMAGFEHAPLLQEPIAAAVAYGATPASRNQRWMIFDLGGGTLDIAIVSTRNGRLSVLEHQGNNRLGGKDIDRVLAEQFLLAPLAASFRLPDPAIDPAAHQRLLRALTRYAELAKIALSNSAETTVEMFDLGEDLDGKPLEIEITLKRTEMEGAIGPIIEQCIALGRRAMDGARLAKQDLDRILLVGGPTRMPIVRAALESGLGAKLDHSLDPMTVVSHGAALYASTLEKPSSTPAAGTFVVAPPRPAGIVRIELAYERACGTPQSPVAGLIDPASTVREIKIDGGGGFWTSGWLPLVNGAFAVDVMLNDRKPVTRFSISARDARGSAVAVDPAEFSVSYMLPMAAPPLPHTVAIELSTTNGITRFDPIFERHCPLPAESRKTYKADRTLKPSEIQSTLPIKFWEIEVSDDPQEKWWAGCIHIRADAINRPITEGSELELIVKMDASRRMTVELFIPLLNQSFSNSVYLPDPPTARSQLQQQLDGCFERLNFVREEVYESDRDDLTDRIDVLQERAEAIAEQISEDAQRGNTDPDSSLGPTESLRKLRMQIAQVEEQLDVGAGVHSYAREMRWVIRYVGRATDEHGTEIEKQHFEKLAAQYERFSESNDGRGLKWVKNQLWNLHHLIVNDKLWYWQGRLSYYKTANLRFLNKDEAARIVVEADTANAGSDLPALRSACNKLRTLLPPEEAATAREQESQSGLRGG